MASPAKNGVAALTALQLPLSTTYVFISQTLPCLHVNSPSGSQLRSRTNAVTTCTCVQACLHACNYNYVYACGGGGGGGDGVSADPASSTHLHVGGSQKVSSSPCSITTPHRTGCSGRKTIAHQSLNETKAELRGSWPCDSSSGHPQYT